MEAKALNIAQRFMSGNDPSHDIAHANRVVANAKKLLAMSPEANSIDLDVLVTIAALHDCMDHKYVSAESLPARIAKVKTAITNELGFTEAMADYILETIDNISYSKEALGGKAATSDDLYLVLARDADRLESIGAIGIARCFAYSGSVNRLLATNDFQVEKAAAAGTLPEKTNASAVMHFYEKLLNLKTRMKTEAGKRLAEQRHNFLLAFLQQIHLELD